MHQSAMLHGKQPKGGPDPFRAAANQVNAERWQREQQKLNEKLAEMERRRDQKAAAARLAEKAALLAAEKPAPSAAEEAAKEAAPKAAREARFLELGMKFEAHRNASKTYPQLTPQEFAEAGGLLGESGTWNEPDDKDMSWRANAAAHLDIVAFTQAIKDSSGTSGTTEAVANPYASIVDAVFEAHGLPMGL